MRVIDRYQLLALIAHGALRTKKIFRRGFISDERISRYVAQAINRSRFAISRSADQAAALVRRGFMGMPIDYGVLFARKRQHDWRSLAPLREIGLSHSRSSDAG